jgi:solute carrier family 13 (sodium-dependent dicarboxylate transporter), member 2/3/5
MSLKPGWVRRLGLVIGPLLALGAWLWTGAVADPLSPAGRATAAVAVLMACWWLTQAIPLAATALLPVLLFPLLGAGTTAETTAPYSRPLIFLFLGGFLLGLAVQRWGLHRRIALLVLVRIGTQPSRLVAGFMLVTAALSMWISNTATVITLLPIAVSVLDALGERLQAAPPPHGEDAARLAPALLLGVAYGASIGGMATLIGTPPNLILAAFLGDRYGFDLSMQGWLPIGLPLVAVLLPLAWLYLTRIAFPLDRLRVQGGEDLLRAELSARGPMGRGERVVAVVFALTALGWMLRPQLAAWSGLPIDDAVIAMAGALALFVIPVEKGRFAMDWESAQALPWGILILFGGGLSLAAAIERNGVDAFLANSLLGLQGVGFLWTLLAVTALVVFLTEITSNTAVTAALLPVLAATATALDQPPMPILMAAALAASCAFMLPVATPPNAVVFASGRVTAGQMAGAGLGLNLIAILLITALVFLHPGLPTP